ncbi:hypothetical protein ACXIUS_20665 [Bosea thiooxidans]|nr:hypothetical protein [Bosea sp. (in: a-proteobacteria)]
MSVSRLRGQTPRIVTLTAGAPACTPPFWELEDLLATGLDRSAALQVMAARRADLTLVGDARPGKAHPGLVVRFKSPI